MAYKRKLVVKRKTPEPAKAENLPKELSWRDWFLKRYARYWYWIGAVFLDIVIFFETQRTLQLDVPIALMFTILAAVAEFYLYARIWGRYGPLREQDDEED